VSDVAWRYGVAWPPLCSALSACTDGGSTFQQGLVMALGQNSDWARVA
jgi:hypothetical protein